MLVTLFDPKVDLVTSLRSSKVLCVTASESVSKTPRIQLAHEFRLGELDGNVSFGTNIIVYCR